MTSASGISMSSAPAANRLALICWASAEIARIVFASREAILASDLPRMTAITCSYVNRAFERITDFENERLTTSPFLSKVRKTENARRSSSGTSEQTPLQSSSGSIGTTLSQRYTLVERRYASRSIALPGFT